MNKSKKAKKMHLKKQKVFLCQTSAFCDTISLFTTQLLEYFKTNGIPVTKSSKSADVIIINTMCDRNDWLTETSLKIIDFYTKKYPSKKIIVTGCLLDKYLKPYDGLTHIMMTDKTRFDNIFNPRTNIKEVQSNLINPSLRRENQKEGFYYIVVSLGCLNNCSYCIQKRSLPNLVSKDLLSIKKEFKEGIKKGYKDFCISGTDIGVYGRDKGLTILDLFSELFKEKGDWLLHIVGIEPGSLLKYFSQLKQYFKSGKIAHLTLAIQSGSNKVLKDMNREYAIEDVISLVTKLRKIAPKMKIITDIIYCFPTETREDFKKSIEVLKFFDYKSKLYNSSVSKYVRREGIKSYKFKNVFDTKEKEYRVGIVSKLKIDLKKDKNKKILLISVPSPDPPPTYFGPPYGLAWIAAVLEKNGKSPICLDFERESTEEMLKKIKSTISNNKIKYVGISCQSSNRGYVYNLIKALKKIDDEIVIILGGPFATQKYDLLLENFPVNFIVIGDGELTFNELIDCLESKGNPSIVRGIAYQKNNKIVRTADREKIKNLDELPYPALHFFDVEKWLNRQDSFLMREVRKKKIKTLKRAKCVGMPDALMFLSSIGCLYGCSFCPMSGMAKDKYREHTLKYFVDMVEHFKDKYNQKYFIFGDNFFTKDMERAKQICTEIIKRNLNIEWSCMTRTDYVDKELLKKMKKAGCIEISFGVESCSEKVQKSIGKYLNLGSVEKAFAMCEKEGIRAILMLMVGNQGETKETIYETLNKIKELEPDGVHVKITKVYPGTKIHDLAENHNLIAKDFYLTPDPNPISFTVENTPQQLKKFKGMFKLRDVRLEMQDLCNNNCVHCRKGEGKIKKTEELKKDILKFAERVSTLTFCGKEPTIRKDIFELTKYANNVGVHVQIETNARIFSYKNAVNKFSGLRINKFIVPFFTADEKLHENITRTKGSFKQTCEGIRNLCTSRNNVLAILNIFKLNLAGLEKTVDLLLSLGANEFRFVYEPTATLELPDLKQVKPHLEKAFFKLNTSRKDFTVTGVPYCIIPDYEDEIDEIHRPFDEIYDLNNNLINAGKERRKKKAKDNRCKGCRYDMICEGFWKETLNNKVSPKTTKEYKGDKIKILVHKKNYKDMPKIVQKYGKNNSFIFKLLPPKEAEEKGLIYVEVKELIPHLRRTLKGLKNYKVIGLPKCLLGDPNTINVKRKDKVKSEGCNRCKYDSECGGVYSDYPGINKLLTELIPINDCKDKLINYINIESNIDKNKFHSLGVLNSTSVCNLNCIFCNEAELHKNPEHTPLETVKKIILNLKKRKVTSINFMGGEVTTRPDVLELLEFVQKEGLKVGIATNCLKFSDKKFCRSILERVDFMEISMHALDKDSFKRLYRSNKFNMYIKGLNNLAKLNKEFRKMIVINTLLSSFNYKKLVDIVNFAIKNFSKKNMIINFRMIEKEGNAKDNPLCMVPFSQCRAELFKALGLAKENGLSVKVDNVPVCLLKGYEEYSRTVLESVQKLDQYYFNKIKLSADMDYQKAYNKHRINSPNYLACKQCLLNFLCTGLGGNEFIDKGKLINELRPIKKDIVQVIKKAKKNLVLAYKV